MRITSSERKWAPFAGVYGVVVPNAGGSGPAGGYRYGETEDYYARCIRSPPNTKWVQLRVMKGCAYPVLNWSHFCFILVLERKHLSNWIEPVATGFSCTVKELG
ncbi:MAG: hypothetical protein C5S47_03415 [Candidatus Methanogasteraceae archaeon]|nr:MAG: hypothetical protein C5S47_03415 [ANME-2 cluster archaeon]